MSPVHSVPAVGETNGIFSLPTVPLLMPCLLTFLVSSLYLLAATLQNGTHSRCHAGPISHRSMVCSHLFHIMGSKSVALVIPDVLLLWHTSTFNELAEIIVFHVRIVLHACGCSSTYHQGSSVKGHQLTQTLGLLPQLQSSLQHSQVAERWSESFGWQGYDCYCQGSPDPHLWVSVDPDVQRNFLIIT